MSVSSIKNKMERKLPGEHSALNLNAPVQFDTLLATESEFPWLEVEEMCTNFISSSSSTTETLEEYNRKSCSKGKSSFCAQSPTLFTDQESLNSSLDQDIPQFVMDCSEKPIMLKKKEDLVYLSSSESSSASISPKFLSPATESSMYPTSFFSEANLKMEMVHGETTVSNENRIGYGNQARDDDVPFSTTSALECHTPKNSRKHKKETDKYSSHDQFLPKDSSPLNVNAQEKFDIIDKCLLLSLGPVLKKLDKGREDGKEFRSVRETRVNKSMVQQSGFEIKNESQKVVELLGNQVRSPASKNDKLSAGTNLCKRRSGFRSAKNRKDTVYIKEIPKKCEDVLQIKYGEIKNNNSNLTRELTGLIQPLKRKNNDLKKNITGKKVKAMSDHCRSSSSSTKGKQQHNSSIFSKEFEDCNVPQHSFVFESQGFVPSTSLLRPQCSKDSFEKTSVPYQISTQPFSPTSSTQPFSPTSMNLYGEDGEFSNTQEI